MEAENWNKPWQVVGQPKEAGSVLVVLAEAVEKEAAEKVHDYYEARGIHCAVVKVEIKF